MPSVCALPTWKIHHPSIAREGHGFGGGKVEARVSQHVGTTAAHSLCLATASSIKTSVQEIAVQEIAT